jgi:hypoxanthine phosphoribosyltransferase
MALQHLVGVRVLVVEDTADSREMLRVALEYKRAAHPLRAMAGRLATRPVRVRLPPIPLAV